MNAKKERASNIELLRIVSILLIILGHYFNHGIGSGSPEFATMGQKATCFLFSGNVGVHLFVLISGYFMIFQQITLKKLAKLACIISFYSLSLFLFVEYCVRGNNNISLSETIHHLFPIMYSKYWFISTYVQLIILSPFINQLIRTAGAQKNLYLLAISALCCVYFRIETHPLLLFVFLYSLAAYIRLYAPSVRKFSAKTYFISFVLLYTLSASALYWAHIAGYQYHYPQIKRLASLFILSIYSFPVIFTSVLCFLAFTRLQIASNKIINIVAGTTLAIYLIHEHPSMRYLIWNEWLNTKQMLCSPYLYLHCIISVLGVCAVCSIIELLRNAIMQKPLAYIIDKLVSPPERMLANIATRCSRYLSKE